SHGRGHMFDPCITHHVVRQHRQPLQGVRRVISSAVEHCLHTAGVTCSIHVSPTNSNSPSRGCFHFWRHNSVGRHGPPQDVEQFVELFGQRAFLAAHDVHQHHTPHHSHEDVQQHFAGYPAVEHATRLAVLEDAEEGAHQFRAFV